jgi:hypothetical protein
MKSRSLRSMIGLATAGLLVAAMPLAAQARGGASAGSPGQQFRANGPSGTSHGASGYAPGQKYRTNGAVTGTNGASGYAPGHTK